MDMSESVHAKQEPFTSEERVSVRMGGVCVCVCVGVGGCGCGWVGS